MQKYRKSRATRTDSIGSMKSRRKFFVIALFGIAIISLISFGAIASIRTSRNSDQSLRAIMNGIPTSVAVPVVSSSSALQGICPIEEKKVTVVGTSLSGFIEPGTILTVLGGYYACHDPKPGDVVIYFYGGLTANDPLIKIVKGIPGDIVSLRKKGGSWNILVNGKPLQTTSGIPYAIAQQGFDSFSAYVNAAKGIIPPDEYMILGNLPAGSIDSTKFGFVRKQDLVGKVAE